MNDGVSAPGEHVGLWNDPDGEIGTVEQPVDEFRWSFDRREIAAAVELEFVVDE
jgi:hypothetical protein